MMHHQLVHLTLPYDTTDLPERSRVRQAAAVAWDKARGASPFQGAAGWLSMHLFLLEARWPEARALAAKRDVLAQDRWAEAPHLLGALARHQGHPTLGWQQVKAFLPDGPATEPGGMVFWAAVAIQELAAYLALDAGDLPVAGAWIGAFERWLSWSGAVQWCPRRDLLRAHFERAAGRTDRAIEHARAALASASDPAQPLSLLAAHRLLGELATDSGAFDEAERHLHRSLTLADASAAAFERALTLLVWAELSAARGGADDARARLEEVRKICGPLDAKPTLERAAKLEKLLGLGT